MPNYMAPAALRDVFLLGTELDGRLWLGIVERFF